MNDEIRAAFRSGTVTETVTVPDGEQPPAPQAGAGDAASSGSAPGADAHAAMNDALRAAVRGG